MSVLHLPFPPKELNPNKKIHWAQKAKIVKSYKDECLVLTRNSGIKVGDGRIPIKFEIIVPDNRHRDDDNLIASTKALRDGVSWALGVDDYLFDATYKINRTPIKGGAVIITFED